MLFEKELSAMIIKPKAKGFICTTAHPTGCAANIKSAINEIKAHKNGGDKKLGNVLIIGASTGYGLASRLVSAFEYTCPTLGIFFERPGTETRTATAGWYNSKAFEEEAAAEGLIFESINADAFSDETKSQTIEVIKNKMPGGKVDIVIYSLASPKRNDPRREILWPSCIKPIGESFKGKTIDFHSGVVSEVEVAPATPEEIEGTVKVMGGEDWLWWIEALKDAGVLSPSALTVAFSYLGPEITHAIYKNGTIGKAKEDMEEKAREITKLLSSGGGKAVVSVNKGLVTQASSAIPVVPLYISILYKVMKEKGLHEECTGQMIRLFEKFSASNSFGWNDILCDIEGRIRVDDWEMRPDIQAEVLEIWNRINTENVAGLSDLEGYRRGFFSLFGFGADGVDYDADVEV